MSRVPFRELLLAHLVKWHKWLETAIENILTSKAQLADK
jgi:hypothetical protein